MDIITRIFRYFCVVLTTGLLFLNTPAFAVQNVYVLYGGQDKALVKVVIERLPANVKVKKYNTDLLRLADYSGKQKVVAKLRNSDFVVFLGEATHKLFDESALNSVTSITFEPDDLPQTIVVEKTAASPNGSIQIEPN